jgi:hypothetical protein
MRPLAWLLLFPVAIILHLGTTTTAVLAAELPEIGLQVTVLQFEGSGCTIWKATLNQNLEKYVKVHIIPRGTSINDVPY